jgi:hypothetical protein
VKAARLATILSLSFIATTSCSRTHSDPQQFSGPRVDAPHFAGSSLESTDPQTADLIARVKDVSASSLERGLPTVRLEDWVRVNAGPDWIITWGFSQGPVPGFPDSVDVRGDTKDGRYFRLSIGTTTNKNQVLLFWLSGAANVQHRWVGLEHLSRLPRLLHHPSQSSHNSGGQK